MKLVNSRGRVLFEVTRAYRVDGITRYDYQGDRCGGCPQELNGIRRAIEAIQADAPSARLVGFLPEPVD